MRSYAIVSSTLAGVGYSHYESEPILGDLLLTPFHAKYDTRVCHNILVRIPPFVNCSELSLSVLILLVQMVKNVYPYKNGWRAEFRMFGKKVIGLPVISNSSKFLQLAMLTGSVDNLLFRKIILRNFFNSPIVDGNEVKLLFDKSNTSKSPNK